MSSFDKINNYDDNKKIITALDKLSYSKFRTSFKLKDKDKNYFLDKGRDKIESHARDFISKRLASNVILNDGKQTPTHGHPVFIAQHATATCCRECLFKWHKIEKHKNLSQEEQDYIVKVIMTWIDKNMNEK